MTSPFSVTLADDWIDHPLASSILELFPPGAVWPLATSRQHGASPKAIVSRVQMDLDNTLLLFLLPATRGQKRPENHFTPLQRRTEPRKHTEAPRERSAPATFIADCHRYRLQTPQSPGIIPLTKSPRPSGRRESKRKERFSHGSSAIGAGALRFSGPMRLHFRPNYNRNPSRHRSRSRRRRRAGSAGRVEKHCGRVRHQDDDRGGRYFPLQ